MERLDPDQIYDPNVSNNAPKIKPLFRITKEHHKNLSCRSSHFSSSFASPTLVPTMAGADLNNISTDLKNTIQIGAATE